MASKYTHAHARHVCMSCLQSFTSSRILHKHERYCLMHEPQQCIYPSGDEAKLAFTRRQYQFLNDFYLVADFKCFLVTSDDGTTSTHVPSAYCVYLVVPHERYRMPPHAYVDNGAGDVMDDFFRYVFDLSKTIDNILSRNIPMRALSDDEQREFDRQSPVTIVERSFRKRTGKRFTTVTSVATISFRHATAAIWHSNHASREFQLTTSAETATPICYR